MAHDRMSLEVQALLFRMALTRVAHDELLNEVLELTLERDGTVRIDRYGWPP